MKGQTEGATPKTQNDYSVGIKSGVFGLVANVLLFVAKLLTGIFTASISIMADAFNNMSDGASSAITVVGYKLASRPADREHPFGHARFEYVAALIVSVAMFVIGAIFLKESVGEIFSSTALAEIRVYVYVVLGLSILTKGAQAVVYALAYKKTKSLPMRAAAADSIGDVAATTVATISTVIRDLTGKNLDGYFGALISLFILFTAVKLMKEGISPLLGAAPSEDLVGTLREKILGYQGVLGVHDIVMHSYGEGRTYAVVHLEVSAEETLTAAHELADRIEREVQQQTGVNLVVHLDPRDTGAEKHSHEKMLIAFLSARFPGIAVHDFRLVKEGGTTRAFFDAELAYESKVTKEEIVAALCDFDPACEYILQIDRK